MAISVFRRISRWGVMLSLTFLCTSLLSAQENEEKKADPPKGGKFALLVGVKQYDPTELNNLRYAEDDVTELAKVLSDSGYQSDNVMLMTQTQGKDKIRSIPLAVNIRKELDLILEGRTKDDVVVIAFAGHGVQFKDEDENFFCPMDAKLTDRSTLISLKEIQASLEKCPAALKVLLVDACRNDPQTQNSRARPEVKLESETRPPAEVPPEGIAAFYSCSKGQKAYEDADLKHGVFFYFVIEALRGSAARDNASDIFLNDLEYFVNRGVEPFVRTKLGQKQLPHLVFKAQGQTIPLVSWPKTDKPKAPVGGSFKGIDPRYLPDAIGPTDRANLPGYSSKQHTLKRVTVLRQITNHRPNDAKPYLPAFATISGDGSKIAYFAPETGIYTINPDGSDNKLILPNKQGIAVPVYNRLLMSHDGNHIFWQGNFNTIYRVNSDGSDLRELSKDGAEYADPRLRRWGNRIYYGNRGGIYSVDTEGVGDLQPILTQKDLFNVFNMGGLLLGEFDVSEIGLEMACRIYDPDLKKEQLFAFPVGGDPVSGLRLIVETDFRPERIVMSPDGRQVFFTSPQGEPYVVNYDGTGMRKLELPPVSNSNVIKFSTDGRWIQYTVPYGGTILARLDGTDRVEPIQAGRWGENSLNILSWFSDVTFSSDFRRFVYIMNAGGGEMPKQLVVGEINPAKIEGVPRVTAVAFPKQLAKDPALPNHAGTFQVTLTKGAKPPERVQLSLSPMMNPRAVDNPVWEVESGFFALKDTQAVDNAMKGDMTANDDTWTTNNLSPSSYAFPRKYSLRVAIHDKTSFRTFEKAHAIFLDFDGVEVK